MASESPIITLLGSQVLKKTTDSTELVNLNELLTPGKVVGIYFSAHWCPPCRTFTPKLADWYINLPDNQTKNKLEIIFVSSDKDQAQFDSYYKEMPWCALPYEHRDIKANASKKYGVKGIPTLLLLDAATGKLITKNGRDIVDTDPTGSGFPWQPKSVIDLVNGLGDALIDTKGNSYNISDVTRNKYVGLFFSASWCPPCKTFTPILEKNYEEHKDKFEIIFLSLDRDEAALDSYFKDMPWKSLKFADQQKHTTQITQKFDIKGIPAVVVLDQDFNVVSINARNIIDKDTDLKCFPWASNTVRSLKSELDFAYFISCQSIIMTVEAQSEIEAAKTQLREYIDYFVTKREPDTLLNGFVLHTKEEDLGVCKNILDHICKDKADSIFFVCPTDQTVSSKEVKRSISLNEAKDLIDEYIHKKIDMTHFS